MRAFIESVYTSRPSFHDFLRNTRIEIMRALRRYGRIRVDCRRICRSRELGDGALWDRFERRRREVPGVADVERGQITRFVDDVQPWAELVFIRKRVFEIEAPAEIDSQLLERLPFILQ